MGWAAAPQKREQMVLFSRRLEDALPADHSVRLLDEILGRLNWAAGPHATGSGSRLGSVADLWGEVTAVAQEAFVYDEQQDCYWCPQGQALPAVHKTSELRGKERVERVRYQAEASVCASCPLLARCVKPGTTQRTVSRDQHESKRNELARRMATPAAQAKYKRRKEVAERPFAMIKHHFGVRRFLLRSLDQVRTEWRWLATAFNLHRMMSLWNTRAGPAPEPLLLTPD